MAKDVLITPANGSIEIKNNADALKVTVEADTITGSDKVLTLPNKTGTLAITTDVPNITGGASTIVSSNLTTGRALISDGSGKVAVSAVTSTELGYLDGVTSPIQTQLNGKAAVTHKYHSFSNGQYFFDTYEQGNYFRLFTEIAAFDQFRFQPISDVEYYNGAAWVAWSGGDALIKLLIDGREETGFGLDHTHRIFRFTVQRSGAWPTLALLVLQETWTGLNHPDTTITIETYNGSAWILKDTTVFGSTTTGNSLGMHIKATSTVHDGISATRVTVTMSDWTDSGSYTTIPLRRLMFLSNFNGGVIHPWTWDYNKKVTINGALAASNFSGSSSGTNTGDQTTITGNAGSASAVATSAENTGTTSRYILFADSVSGNQALKTDTGLTYHPTNNALTATTFIGALTGNADTATTATKLGSATVGSTQLPIYLNAGTATAITQANLRIGLFGATAIGSASQPIYLAANGVPTAGNTIPTVYNSTLTITAGNGLTTGGTFTTNQSSSSSVTVALGTPSNVTTSSTNSVSSTTHTHALTLPQSIDTTATPTFSSVNLGAGSNTWTIDDTTANVLTFKDGSNKRLEIKAGGLYVNNSTTPLGEGSVTSVSLESGTNNGTLKLTVNGTATDNVAVKGLGSAAYTASTAYVAKNTSITGATKTKITYDSKGLVTGGADLSSSDIPALAYRANTWVPSWSDVSGKPTTLSGFGITDGAVNFGSRANTATTTAAFITLLTSWGMFNYGHSFCKFSWSYAGNEDITDITTGSVETAGAVCETWQNGDGTKMVRLICVNTGTGNAYREFIYNDQGAGYSPGWREVWNSRTLTNLNQLTNGPGYVTSSGVTSVSAGNGLNFTTITGTGSVTLGTPGTLTSATTNDVTATSHTHAITTYNLSGTTNQITVTGAGKILGAATTLSLPQNIHTAASPTFAGPNLGAGSNTWSIDDTTSNTMSFKLGGQLRANINSTGMSVNGGISAGTISVNGDIVSTYGNITATNGYIGAGQVFCGTLESQGPVSAQNFQGPIVYTTTAPTAASTYGLSFYVGTTNPATKYPGWVYIII